MHNAAALMCVFLTHTLGYAHVCVPAPLATILAPLATIPAPLATIEFWRRSLLFQGATRFYSEDIDFNNITVITPCTILNTAALMCVFLTHTLLLGICTCMCPGAARYYSGAARYYSGAARYYSGAARYYSREPLASILRTLISTTSQSSPHAQY